MEQQFEESTSDDQTAFLQTLLVNLSSVDAAVRGQARHDLVRLGTPTIVPLIQLLNSQSSDLRWEVTNTLSHMDNPIATNALITKLDDDRRGVRWLAANGLIAIGQPAIIPLLQALIADPADACLLQGAHHVLAALRTNAGTDALGPVVKALEGPIPAMEAQVAAYHAIEQLEQARARQG